MQTIHYTPEKQFEESRRSSHAAGEQASGRRDGLRSESGLHPALSFLSAYGVAPNLLLRAVREAAGSGNRPEAALMASGLVSEEGYYRALARHLGLPFCDDAAELGPLTAYPHSILAGAAPLADGGEGPAWLLAPHDNRLDELLTLHRRGHLPRNRFAITTPARLERLVAKACEAKICDTASSGLEQQHGKAYSARHWQWRGWRAGAFLAIAAVAAVWMAGDVIWQTLSFLLALLLAGFITIRLFAAAASCDAPQPSPRRSLTDTELPVFSIIVALYHEASVVAGLVAGLDRIDYPASKLDIALVIEADDSATRLAIENLSLPARYRIVIAPQGIPRTKPRALNVALPLARGSLICVFDAEDFPQSGQLREAAERFAALPPKVACLQGRLAIDNGGDSWLAGCFAIEYASLFDVVNPGLAALDLPVPLGGTSNHFRTGILREIGGWDAWNVTEDIDLGLRLARFGYLTGMLEASTFEEAPADLGRWMRQRRRWFKGWIQTLLVHGAHPLLACRQIGLGRAVAAFLLIAGTLAGALLGPACAAWAIRDAIFGELLYPGTTFELLASTVWCYVGVSGIFAALWPAILGMRRRGLTCTAGALASLPVYWLLMAFAAWWAVVDFARDPFVWLKTDHGLARHRGMQAAPLQPA